VAGFALRLVQFTPGSHGGSGRTGIEGILEIAGRVGNAQVHQSVRHEGFNRRRRLPRSQATRHDVLIRSRQRHTEKNEKPDRDLNQALSAGA